MLYVKNLKKTYKSHNRILTIAINDVSFQLPNTGMVVFVGKSGCGKSTLLNLLAGLDIADQGKIFFNDIDVTNLSNQELDYYRKENISIIFQDYNLIDHFTVYENLCVEAELHSTEWNKEKIREIFSSLNLEDVSEKYPYELSGGQKQRVAIARSILKKTPILLADEPTGALDSKTGIQIMELLKRVSQDHLVVLVTHDYQYAKEYGDRIIELKDGRIVSDTNPLHPQFDHCLGEGKKIKRTNIISTSFASKLSFYLFRHRKGRLMLSTFLISLAFSFIGTISCFTFYDSVEIINRSLMKNCLSLREQNNYSMSPIEQEKLISTQALYPDYEIAPIFQDFTYNLRENFYYDNGAFANTPEEAEEFYSGYLLGAMVWNNERQVLSGFDIVTGRLPTDSHEVAITYFTYLECLRFGYEEPFFSYKENKREVEWKLTPIHTCQEMIGKQLFFNEEMYSITGILDTGFLIDRYQDYVDLVYNDIQENDLTKNPQFDKIVTRLRKEIRIELLSGPHAAIYLSESSSLLQSFSHSYRSLQVLLGNGNKHRLKIIKDFLVLDSDEKSTPNHLKIESRVLVNIDRFSEVFNNYGIYFYIVSGCLAIFAITLLYHDLKMLLHDQKNDIGLLRSIGYNSKSIYKLILLQGLFLLFIDFIVASLLTIIGSMALNKVLQKSMFYFVELFPIQSWTFLGLFGMFFIAGVIAFSIPTFKILHMKPIELLNSLDE